MRKIAAERRASPLKCPSARDEADIVTTLEEFLVSIAYRRGYERTTLRLLNPGENVSYDKPAASLAIIADFLKRR